MERFNFSGTAYGRESSEGGELRRPRVSGSEVESCHWDGAMEAAVTCRARQDKRSEVERVLKTGKPRCVFGRVPLGKDMKRRQGNHGIALRQSYVLKS